MYFKENIKTWKFKVKFVNGILNKHVKEYKGIDGRYSNDEQSVSASFISKFNNEKILFDKDLTTNDKRIQNWRNEHEKEHPDPLTDRPGRRDRADLLCQRQRYAAQ